MSYWIFVIAVVYIVALIIFGILKAVCKNESDEVVADDVYVEDSFDRMFFERTQKGENYQQFLSISSQKDCAIIRSLLHADNIPTYVEGEHMNSIYGGISGTMNAVVAIRLYVLKNDYDKALEIVRGIIESKLENISEDKEKSILKRSLEILGSLSFVSGVANEECLGIIVFPKEVEE